MFFMKHKCCLAVIKTPKTMSKVKGVLLEKKYLIPVILITCLFSLWGFANDITNPMVAAFKTVMEITTAKATLVQMAFYGGYVTMLIPAQFLP